MLIISKSKYEQSTHNIWATGLWTLFPFKPEDSKLWRMFNTQHKNFYLHYYPAIKRYIYILNCLAKLYSDIMKLLFIMTVRKPLMSWLFKYGKPQFSENQDHKVEERWKKMVETSKERWTYSNTIRTHWYNCLIFDFK